MLLLGSTSNGDPTTASSVRELKMADTDFIIKAFHFFIEDLIAFVRAHLQAIVTLQQPLVC